MLKYIFCDQTIVSDIAIADLNCTGHDKAGLFFNINPFLKPSAELPWTHHWVSPGGEITLSCCKNGSYHWLRFPGMADFRISMDGKEISCCPVLGIPVETIRHLLLDQVLPRYLAHQGRLMLHASAVRLEEGLLLFLGESGAGKSTLAGNFHQAGNPAIADDCLWIKEGKDQILAVPAYGGLRLWADSLAALFPAGQEACSMAHYSTKQRVPLGAGASPGATLEYPVLAVFALSPPEPGSPPQISLETLSRREAFIALLKQSFQLDLSDQERMARHAQALGRVVPRLPAYRLSMPRDYSLLPLVRQKILERLLAPDRRG